jgi:RNA polymerase sigma factor (sigma-70 family)
MELEASTIHSPAALLSPRITIGPRLLKLRSDEQLVALFRAGHDEAFRVIYDRYHKRLESYARQMLSGAHDAEDALQDVFVRAYHALREDDRQLAVKPWLFRIVHNRCIDQLRRRTPLPTQRTVSCPERLDDPVVQADAREAIRRLLEDVRRLPEQQRAALLLRELSGISYEEVAAVLGTTVPAVRSLLVRARMGLLRATEARDTSCSEIREQLILAHDQGIRAGATVRRHLRDCPGCRGYRRQVFLVRRRLTAVLPVGPLAALARVAGSRALGFSSAGATSTGGAAPAAALGTAGAASGAVASSASHVATLLAAALASTGGVVSLQHVIASSGRTPRHALVSHRDHVRSLHSAPAGAARAAWSPAASGGAVSAYAADVASGDGVPNGSSGDPAVVAGQGTASTSSVVTVGGDGTSAGSGQSPSGAVGTSSGPGTGLISGPSPGVTSGSSTGSVPTGTSGEPATGSGSGNGTTSGSGAPGTDSGSSGTAVGGVSSGDSGSTTGQGSTGTSPAQATGSPASGSGTTSASPDGSGQTSPASTTTS